LSKIKNTSLKLPVGVSPLQLVNVAAVSRNRYGVEKTVDTHKILLNAIKLYACLQEL
jgi:hypothetical protein